MRDDESRIKRGTTNGFLLYIVFMRENVYFVDENLKMKMENEYAEYTRLTRVSICEPSQMTMRNVKLMRGKMINVESVSRGGENVFLEFSSYARVDEN